VGKTQIPLFAVISAKAQNGDAAAAEQLGRCAADEKLPDTAVVVSAGVEIRGST
jgi:hypothetical protein